MVAQTVAASRDGGAKWVVAVAVAAALAISGAVYPMVPVFGSSFFSSDTRFA